MYIDRKALFRLLKQPKFSPADCPNFLTYKDYEQYRWYARTLAPLLLVTGGGPLFIGNRIDTLHGSVPCDTWMVVRYPSHRGMLRMIMNPYYSLLPNRLREKGTQKLELAFTQPHDPESGLEKCPLVLALHVGIRDGSSAADEFFPAVRHLAGQRGLSVVYESESRLDFDFIREPRDADPSPLTYPVTAVLAGTESVLREFAGQPELVQLLEAQQRASANLYQRGARMDYLRFGKARHQLAHAA